MKPPDESDMMLGLTMLSELLTVPGTKSVPEYLGLATSYPEVCYCIYHDDDDD